MLTIVDAFSRFCPAVDFEAVCAGGGHPKTIRVDNGIGFTDENYKSFKTPDSRLKEARGGKGVGRLAWLKVFNYIGIDSTYSNGVEWKRRRFDFRLTDRNQIEEHETEPEHQTHRTVVSFKGFAPLFDGRAPVAPGILQNRVAAHFIPLFVAGNAPKVTV